eukprot:TRINITY_DN5948_c0_g1_i2.p1 TRINITY_DN5948_c0_g1~~TRINITY_DN5948_c0_g1_i2.p1  ORF type:complete len:372 (-),score=106.88 TRINITY_DN5948_c0_g1_i2:66-1181(-)
MMKISTKLAILVLFSLLFVQLIAAQDLTEETGTPEPTTEEHSHESEEGCEAEGLEDYDLKLHIASFFILMSVSMVAVGGPTVLHKLRISLDKNKVLVWMLRVAKFFGTGVILATAFIHMLPESFELFGSECLTEGWKKYGAFGGLFPMIAALMIQFVEFSALCQLDKMIEDKKNKKVSEMKDVEKSGEETPEIEHLDCEGHAHGLILDQDHSASLTVYILEFGIAIHSILIGIALSVTTGSEFKPLLAALIFHQFFEGLALGVRINEIHPKKWGVPLLMCLVYSLTTPLGIAIGLGVRYSYNPNSQAAVLSSAILDSFAAGILLYNAFVNLIGYEMNQNKDFRGSSMSIKLVCFISLYLGAAAMAIVGYWA